MAIGAAALNWTAFNFYTGQIILDSAQISLDNSADLEDLIAQVSTVQVTLNLEPSTPSPDWIFATEKGNAAWIAWNGDPLNPNIVWGGIVSQRIRVLTPQVTMQLSTAEAYFDGCQMGLYNAAGAAINQDTILAQIVTQFAAGTNQPNWQLIPSGTPSIVTQVVTYPALPNVTVLQALQALSAVSTGGVPGPEWFVGWQWNLNASTIYPTITYGQRIGRAAGANGPAVTFEIGDLLDGSAFTEDYTSGRGANQVTALGAAAAGAAAGSIPSATATAVNLQGRPLWNYTYTPNSQISDPAVLAAYAAKALAALQSGNQPIVIVFDITRVGKVYGVDFGLGDDIGWYLANVIQFPIPISGTARVIGVKVSPTNACTLIIQGAVLS